MSKDSIFPNGKDTLIKDNIKKVCEDASNYIKNNVNNDLNSSSTWKNQISMYGTFNGSTDEAINIVECQNELISKCSTSSKTISDYQRKLTLNNISINANIIKSNKLIEFIECSGN